MAMRTVPPISTDGVPTIAAADISPFFRTGSTIIELLQHAQEPLCGRLCLSAATTGSNTQMIANSLATWTWICFPPVEWDLSWRYPIRLLFAHRTLLLSLTPTNSRQEKSPASPAGQPE